MKKIKSFDELPEWFNLDSYLATAEFRAIDWYNQLTQRQYLHTLLNYKKEENPQLSDSASRAFSRNIKFLRGINIELASIPNFFGEKGLVEHLKNERRGIHSLTFRHLREHAQNLLDFHCEPDTWFQHLSSQADEFTHEENSPPDHPLTLSSHLDTREHFATARVNLDLPDEVLRASFDSWLAEARQNSEQPEEKRHYKPVFQRWARWGLLPLIDLEIWSLETGAKLPDRVISAVLFPRGDSSEDTIRKTIRPLARSLMKDLSELQALAALEADAEPTDQRKMEI